MELLRSYHAAVKAGTRCSMRQLMELRGLYSAVGTENIAYCARACGIDVFKAHRYVHKHSDLTKQTHNQVAGIWKDYLDIAQKLNYDMSREDVVMPKDPFKRHDEAAANYGAIEQEIKDKLYARRYRELEKKYAFSMGGYSIVVPKTAEQIIEEGKTLKICVGGYAARHIEGGTTILFLRKTRKTGTSYVCIEMGTGLDDWKIKQIHGYRNEWYTGAVSPKVRHAEFINTWLEWVRNGSQRDKQGNPIIKERKTA